MYFYLYIYLFAWEILERKLINYSYFRMSEIFGIIIIITTLSLSYIFCSYSSFN